jgi:threonine/homoserine/homoserine lactone efflux protein
VTGGAVAVLAPLAAVWTLAVILPGPNFFAITYAATMRGRRAAVLTALGCLTGTAFWIATGLLGLKALFAVLPFAGMAIRIAGAAYLIWAGVQMVRRAGVGPAAPRRSGGLTAYRTGLQTTLANPKSAALAASLLAVALPTGHHVLLTAEAFATLFAISCSWYLPLALFASTAWMTRVFLPVRAAIGRLAGAVFVLFGIKLAIEQ